MRLLKDIVNIFYPKLCAICEDPLLENEKVLCTICRHDLPLTNINDFKDNKVIQTFYGKIVVEKAFSLLFFRKKGSVKKLIHELKYKGNEDIGAFFGNWIGLVLKENKELDHIHYIIPVPLHPKKLRMRGYNQVTKFGKNLSKHLDIPYLENHLLRISSSKTQTFKSRFERFNNLGTKFTLNNPNLLKNKNILLIDDVITTGATLEACSKELINYNCKISILTIAYTE